MLDTHICHSLCGCRAALGGLVAAEAPLAARRKQVWPGTIPEQVRAIKDALRMVPLQTVPEVAAGFKPASRRRVEELLETLTALGQARYSEGRYSV